MRQAKLATATSGALIVALLLAWGCRWMGPAAVPDAPEALPPVRPASEEVVVAAWAEPPRLPPGGGQAQILVRAQTRDGRPFPGVEVRLQTSAGSLYSGSRILVTDARGMTRDRLTTRHAATIVLNAGGTRYKFHVPVEGVTPGH